jgi:PqqD family protein of HPr-rel-A system
MDHPRIRDLAISNTGFVFDPHTGATFSANDTGLEILRALGEGLDRAAIAARLRERFAVEGSELDRDLSEFLLQLRRDELIDQIEAGP